MVRRINIFADLYKYDKSTNTSHLNHMTWSYDEKVGSDQAICDAMVDLTSGLDLENVTSVTIGLEEDENDEDNDESEYDIIRKHLNILDDILSSQEEDDYDDWFESLWKSFFEDMSDLADKVALRNLADKNALTLVSSAMDRFPSEIVSLLMNKLAEYIKY